MTIGCMALPLLHGAVTRPDWKLAPVPTWLYWLKGYAVSYEPDGTEVSSIHAWVPLVVSLAWFVVCVALMRLVTMRREVRRDRRLMWADCRRARSLAMM